MREIVEIEAYMPRMYFDEHEPFFPVGIGYTVWDKPGVSPSFKQRPMEFYDPAIAKIIQYAVYWHFDIQHMYDLEHLWVYIDGDGEVFECEGSFHGKVLRVLQRDRSNLQGRKVKVYSQPGKHAFAPYPEVFDLIPRVEQATLEAAGKGGLSGERIAGKERFGTEDEGEIMRIHEMASRYLQSQRFTPARRYAEYPLSRDIFVPWETLQRELPGMIREKLREMKQTCEGKS